MTMKTKRRLAISGGTIRCAALALLIVMRFAPENKQLAPSILETALAVNVDIPAPDKEKPESTELVNNIGSDKEVTSQLEISFIENDNIKFSDVEQSTPSEPPKVENEMTLIATDTEPTYTPEQVQTQKPTTSDTPKHGDTKDGMIYGFGWVKDEGGGGRGGDASDIYENGNKIGCFG